jgi:hypothetical protein
VGELIGNWTLISMECFHGHHLSLPGWVAEQRFLGSIFLGHFYWVLPKNRILVWIFMV